MPSIGLNTGLRALLTSQAALDTLGHNLANANTPGYSRQSLHASPSRPIWLGGVNLGTGVQGDAVLRATDDLLSRRIVGQIAVVDKLDTMLLGMGTVEALLGEPGGVGLGSLIDDFFASVADLSANVEDGVFRTGVVHAVEGLAAQFHHLAGELAQQRQDTMGRVDLVAGEVNTLADEILQLNLRIVESEAGGRAANDLRDQRDVALRELAGLVDVVYHEDQDGAVRVTIAGQFLVGATTAQSLEVEQVADTEFVLRLEGGTRPIEVTGGQLGGLLELVDGFVPALQTNIDALARSMIFEVNRAHSTGVPHDGGFRQLTASYAFTDVDGDGNVRDELLADAGLPFDVVDGVLHVNIVDETTGELETHRVDVAPNQTTVQGFLDSLNAVPGISADLDTLGRINILADGGLRFDFGRRLDALPDGIGSFGGGQASLGSAIDGPFALTDGDTLDLTGQLGAFTIAFSAGDFADINQATAAEVAAAINADPSTNANMLRAAAVGDQLVLQSLATGSSATFDVTGGSALAALGLSATTVTGHDTAVGVTLGGSYTGETNQRWSFRALGDGTIGTTPGLQVEVLDEAGLRVALLDVGAGYVPGTALGLPEGLEASFTFGTLSATDNDSFVAHVLADSDTSDVLAATGLNSLLEGTDAETFRIRADVARDPLLIAASASGAVGDNGALLDLLALQHEPASALDGSFTSYYGDVVGRVGFEIGSTRSAAEVEQFLTDSLMDRREQISGVNIDEQLVDMIRYEQAFGAASQFIQVVNSIGDEILRLI